MSRYIDADLIEKELTENGFYELDKIPTADVVPVIRCKDCKFFREHLSMNCVYHVSSVCENWFCSQGRVKE